MDLDASIESTNHRIMHISPFEKFDVRKWLLEDGKRDDAFVLGSKLEITKESKVRDGEFHFRSFQDGKESGYRNARNSNLDISFSVYVTKNVFHSSRLGSKVTIVILCKSRIRLLRVRKLYIQFVDISRKFDSTFGKILTFIPATSILSRCLNFLML